MTYYVDPSEFAKRYLIPIDEEQRYCKEKGIIFDRYDNNFKILGIQKYADDDNSCSVNIGFSIGNYADPDERCGLHHFCEHIIASSGVYEYSRENLAYLNASTSIDTLKVIIQATFNTEYPHIGLLPVLSKIFGNIIDSKNINKYFEQEKKVLQEEYALYLKDFDRQSAIKLNELIYQPGSPVIESTLEQIKDLNSITTNDILNIMQNGLVQNNALISILGVGDQSQHDRIYNHIKPELNKIRTGKIQRLDLSVLENLQTNISRNWSKHNLEIPNGLCKITILWIQDIYNDSEESKLAYLISGFINDELFNVVRKSGLAYDGGFNSRRLSPQKFVYQATIVTSKDNVDQKAEQFKDLLNHVLAFDDSIKQRLENYLEKYQIHMKIVPIYKHSLLNFQLENLSDYNQLGDFEIHNQFFQTITVEQLLDSVKNLDVNNAYKFIIGDV